MTRTASYLLVASLFLLSELAGNSTVLAANDGGEAPKNQFSGDTPTSRPTTQPADSSRWIGVGVQPDSQQIRIPGASDDDSDTQPAEYDVQIGDKKFSARPNQTYMIFTEKGERIKVTIHPKPFLQFDGEGVSFEYPRKMTARVRHLRDATTVQVSGGEDSALVIIQVYPDGVSPEVVEKRLTSGFTSRPTNGEGEVKINDAKRRIAGEERPGKSLQFPDKINQLEVYAFSNGDKTIAVILQGRTTHQTEANAVFTHIVESLK
jgi:hypothetical protein